MIKIGKKKIGDNYPAYITFEIGPTHNGYNSCLRYINFTHLAKADAIKIQMVDAERLISNKKQLFEFGYLYNNYKKNYWYGGYTFNIFAKFINIVFRTNINLKEIQQSPPRTGVYTTFFGPIFIVFACLYKNKNSIVIT